MSVSGCKGRLVQSECTASTPLGIKMLLRVSTAPVVRFGFWSNEEKSARKMQAGHCLDLVSLGFAAVKKDMEKI